MSTVDLNVESSCLFQECYCSEHDYCNGNKTVMEQPSSGANMGKGITCMVVALIATTVTLAISY